MKYMVRVRRYNTEYWQRRGLTAPIWPKLFKFEHPTNLKGVSDKTARTILEEQLERTPNVRSRPDLKKEEYVDVIHNVRGGSRVWEGHITLPDKHLPQAEEDARGD